tara:strand:+ start:103 stop:822 length:720 start_codon:yes stop_codon:yes gene_type:complete
MAIQNGLNVRLWVDGKDLSGSANALDGAGYTQNLYETTPLNSSAITRIPGLVDGNLSVSGYFDTTDDAPWAEDSGKLPSADLVVLTALDSGVGDPSVGMLAKEGEYNVSRASGSAITVNSSFSGNGMGGEFGEMLTAFDDTHSSAGSGTVVDSGAASTAGGAGYMQIISLSSGTPTVKIQHATSSSGTYSDLITFTATGTSAVPTAERVTASGTINRYIKVVTTGTFSNAKIVVALARF